MDFWVYIMTNRHDSVLYIGMTNDLSRRIASIKSGEIPGFTADLQCHKLVYTSIILKLRTRLRAKSS